MKRCKHCKQEFEPFRPLQSVCSVDCAVELEKIKEQKKRKRAWNNRKRQLKEEIKTRSELTKELQKLVNQIVREIDHTESCISCRTRVAKFDAGHFFSTGAHPELRFNFLNIYKQCSQCNQHKHGNLLEYRESLILAGVLKEVENLRLEYKELKPSKDDLTQAIIKAKEIRKQVRQGIYKDCDKIELRKLLNLKLGLYG